MKRRYYFQRACMGDSGPHHTATPGKNGASAAVPHLLDAGRRTSRFREQYTCRIFSAKCNNLRWSRPFVLLLSQFPRAPLSTYPTPFSHFVTLPNQTNNLPVSQRSLARPIAIAISTGGLSPFLSPARFSLLALNTATGVCVLCHGHVYVLPLLHVSFHLSSKSKKKGKKRNNVLRSSYPFFFPSTPYRYNGCLPSPPRGTRAPRRCCGRRCRHGRRLYRRRRHQRLHARVSCESKAKEKKKRRKEFLLERRHSQT